MSLSLHKYDKIYAKSRNPYKQPEPVKYKENQEVQLRMYFACESPYYTKTMKVNFWYNKRTKQWRWTLSSDEDVSIQESGNKEDLRAAMNDVANTVEYLLDTNKGEVL